MFLCSNGHDEICYEHECPVCRVEGELDEAHKLITELRKQVEELEFTLEEAVNYTQPIPDFFPES